MASVPRESIRAEGAGDAHLYDLALLELHLVLTNAPGVGLSSLQQRCWARVRAGQRQEGLQLPMDTKQTGCRTVGGTVGSLPFQPTLGPRSEVRVGTELITPKVIIPVVGPCHQLRNINQGRFGLQVLNVWVVDLTN